MILGILMELIHGKDLESMTCSEAKSLVNEFYTRVFKKTIGCRNQAKIERIAKCALEKVGLEYFA